MLDESTGRGVEVNQDCSLGPGIECLTECAIFYFAGVYVSCEDFE